AMVNGTVVTATAAGIYPTDPNRCGTTIAIAGHDGAHYLYCHLSQLAVTPGQAITAGTLIGLSGGQPGTPGAGNTTGPHLHLAIRVNGTAICPQLLLLATYRQQPFAPTAAPTAGCVDGAPLTDWRATLGSA
ncbi:MAG: M23 family metallopeptidase, partial [Acidimicrobiales bacterium]